MQAFMRANKQFPQLDKVGERVRLMNNAPVLAQNR